MDASIWLVYIFIKEKNKKYVGNISTFSLGNGSYLEYAQFTSKSYTTSP